MPIIWKSIFLIYNLVLITIASAVVMLSLGRPEPIAYLDLVLSTPQNRIILGAVAIIVIALTLISLIASLRSNNKEQAVAISKGLMGEVNISINAIKVIILKAIKTIEGAKEIDTIVRNTPQGLSVTIHILINPERNVPELSQDLQSAIKEHLEEIGGLQVAEVIIMVDHHSTAAQKPANM